MSHWDNLVRHVPGLAHASILDLGAGKGAFLLEAAQHGAKVSGLEMSDTYISLAKERLASAGYAAEIVQGVAEKLPFPDNSFDFINMGEVVEHIESPQQMLREAYRVLRPGGHAYLSAPNRYAIRDQHFHLYFVNWIPRSLADTFIALFGKHKEYSDTSAGRQRLADMHYYTYGSIVRLVQSIGFRVEDMRSLRIKKEMPDFKGAAARLIYPLARAAYFDAFHLLLTRPSA